MKKKEEELEQLKYENLKLRLEKLEQWIEEFKNHQATTAMLSYGLINAIIKKGLLKEEDLEEAHQDVIKELSN